MSKEQKRKAGGATVRTPVEELTVDEKLLHYNTVLLEELRSNMRLLAEAVESLRMEMATRAELEAFRKENREQHAVFEAIFKHHTGRIDGHDTALADHESRIGAIERRSA